PFAHLDSGLIQHARNLSKARNVVLVVLDGLEGKHVDKIGQPNLDAILLVNGHLPRLEAGALQLHLEVTDYQRLVQNFLIRKTRRVDGLETGEKFLGLVKILVNSLLRKVVELVVPPLVAKERSSDGARAQAVFPLLRQKIVESLAPGFHRGSSLSRDRPTT